MAGLILPDRLAHNNEYVWVVSYMFDRGTNQIPTERVMQSKQSAMTFISNIAVEDDCVHVSVSRRFK